MTYSHAKNPYLKMYFFEEAPVVAADQPAATTQSPAKEPGFLQSMKQGFQQQYQQQKSFSQDELQNYQATLEKIKPQIVKAVEVAKGIEKWLHHNNVPTQLAVQLIAAGLTGGLGAIPIAALNFGILKVAGRTLDAGISNLKGEWSFAAYYEQRMLLDESLWSDAGAAVGQAAGWVAGKTVKWAGAAANLFSKILSGLKNQAGAIIKYARENKLEVAKAAALTALSILIGTGVGVTYKTLTSPETAQPIAKAILDSNLGSAAEIAAIFGKELVHDVVHIPQHLAHLSHGLHAAGEFTANLTKSAGLEAGAAAGTGALLGTALRGVH